MNEKIINALNKLQNKAIEAGTTFEFTGENSEELLSNLVSDIVDDTNEIIKSLEKYKTKNK